MRKLLPVLEHPDYVKDEYTGMLLNINKEKIMQNQKIREQRAKEREEFEALKSDVQDIKAMLRKLLENSSNA